MKQTEVGLIPDDWEVKSLGDISDNCSYGVGAEAIAFNGRDRYIRITDIDDTSNKYVPQPLTSPSFFSSKDIVNENDILFARTGASVGKTYIYDKKDKKLIFAGFLMRLNIRNANSKFIFYKTITQRYKNWITSESMRTGQPGLNLEQLKSYLVAFPPLEEQQRIAKALSDVDALITTTEKLIQKKKNIKQGTMQNLLTGKKRLPGFAKSTEYKQTELGLIPEDWEITELGNCCLINPQSSSLIPDKFIYIDLESVNSGKLEKKQIFDKKNAPSRAQRIFKMDDILYQTVRPYQKNNLYVNFDSSNYIASTGYVIVRADCKIAISKYIYHILHTNNFVNTVLDNCTGTSYPAINPNFLKTILIPLPPKEEQNAIANVLSCMDKEIETLNTKLEKYRNLKTAMMQQLLTGKIRLVK